MITVTAVNRALHTDRCKPARRLRLREYGSRVELRRDANSPRRHGGHGGEPGKAKARAAMDLHGSARINLGRETRTTGDFEEGASKA